MIGNKDCGARFCFGGYAGWFAPCGNQSIRRGAGTHHRGVVLADLGLLSDQAMWAMPPRSGKHLAGRIGLALMRGALAVALVVAITPPLWATRPTGRLAALIDSAMPHGRTASPQDGDAGGGGGAAPICLMPSGKTACPGRMLSTRSNCAVLTMARSASIGAAPTAPTRGGCRLMAAASRAAPAGIRPALSGPPG